MRGRSAGIALLALLVLGAGTEPVADPAGDAPGAEVRVELTVEPPEVTVGDPIDLTLTVDAPASVPIAFPALGEQLGEFTVLQVGVPEVEARGDRRRHRVVHRLSAFEPGEHAVPDLEVLAGEGEAAWAVGATGTVVTVRSVLGEGGEPLELADIKPPGALPFGLRVGLLALLGALLLAALVGIWWWRRRRAEAPTVATGPPPPPADEEALAALERLLAGPLLGKEHVKAFHVELADIAKRYMFRRFGVPTLERTTFEVVRGSRAAGLEGWVTERLGSVLGSCDAVKFARQRPDAALCHATARGLRDLVLRTPVAPPAAPDLAAAEG